MKRPRIHARRDERGALSIFAVSIMLSLFLAAGLVIDGGYAGVAQRNATAAAQGAARAGGQAISADAVAGAGATGIDVGKATRAAQSYLDAAGVTGTVNVEGGTITVTATATKNTLILGAVGVKQMKGHAQATARLAPGGPQ